MKALFLILFALFIDGLQALISLGLFVIASSGGTVAGGAVGCAAGNYVAGQIGCWLGGGVLGIFGSLANAFLAPVLVPIGIVLAFAVNICLSVVLGGMLTALLWHFKMLYVGYLPGYLAEIMPGVGVLPFWTGFVVASILRKKAEDTATSMGLGAVTSLLSPKSALNTAAASIMGMRGATRTLQTNSGFSGVLRTWSGTAQKQDEGPQKTTRSLVQTIDGVRPPQKSAGFVKSAGLALAFALFFIHPTLSYAQGLGSQPDPIQFTIAPETPGPNQQVYLTVDGVGTFLGNSTITWQQDGKTVTSGVGVRSFMFTTGGVGSATRIRVTIDSAIQGTIVREFVFSPSVVNLVWEADTTTPMFYPGKPLYTAGSKVKVVAFPTVLLQGKRVPDSSISFQWKQSDALVPEQSGLGKNTFTIYGDQLRNAEAVSVELYIGGTKVGAEDIIIPASEPQVLLYARDPLRGLLLDQALLGNVTLLGKEITLKAEPFFFSKISKNRGTLGYEWTLNNEEATGPDSARGLLTLRQTGAGSGFASVAVSLQNTDPERFIQSAQTTMNMTFGESVSLISNLFGL